MAGMDAKIRRDRKRRGAAGLAGSRRYARHRPEDTVLHQIVEQHVDEFFDHISEHGASLPGFVREEFEAYLDCGRLEKGFVRAKCTSCQY